MTDIDHRPGYIDGWNTCARGNIAPDVPPYNGTTYHSDWIKGFTDCVAANLRAGGPAIPPAEELNQ